MFMGQVWSFQILVRYEIFSTSQPLKMVLRIDKGSQGDVLHFGTYNYNSGNYNNIVNTSKKVIFFSIW